MLSSRIYSDKSPNGADSRAVIDAAQALSIREFDFFKLAYQRWCGAAADDKALEKHFVAFMFHGHVPLWVRHLARHVLHQQKHGWLDPRALGADQFHKQEKIPPLGRVYVGVTGLAVLFLFLMILGTDYDPQTSAPMSCPGEIGNRFFEIWAHTIAGREPPPCFPDRTRSRRQPAPR